MYYWESQAGGDDFLVLEPCDWTDEEWKTICKLFGCIEAERIVIRNYLLQAYGTPTEAMRELLNQESGDKYGPLEN